MGAQCCVLQNPQSMGNYQLLQKYPKGIPWEYLRLSAVKTGMSKIEILHGHNPTNYFLGIITVLKECAIYFQFLEAHSDYINIDHFQSDLNETRMNVLAKIPGTIDKQYYQIILRMEDNQIACFINDEKFILQLDISEYRLDCIDEKID